MTHPQKKCPPHAAGCSHYLNEHTAKGGCMHRKPSGAICGCTFTTGAAQGANPFGTIGAPAAVVAVPVPIPGPFNTPKERENTMTERLFNIAGVAAELSVTPQRASAWHRGPDATPAPDFVVDATELELWTADSIDKWHSFVEKLESEKKAAKEAKAKKTEPAAEMPKVDVPAEPTEMPKAEDALPAAEVTENRAKKVSA